MRSFFDVDVRRGLLERLQQVTPESRARWGRMNAEQMLTHLVHSMRMAVGELPVKSRKQLLRFWPIRELAIYVMPWPKGSPTAPELLPANSESIETCKRELMRLAEVFVERKGEWPDHPAFGRRGRAAWGVLVRRHIEHHLTQFGM